MAFPKKMIKLPTMGKPLNRRPNVPYKPGEPPTPPLKIDGWVDGPLFAGDVTGS